LDHETYSTAAAEPLLAWLQQHQIPVIPVTSKTRAEVLTLRQALQLDHPFVVENGAAIFIPQALLSSGRAKQEGLTLAEGFWIKAFAPPRSQWLRWLEHVAEQLPGAFTCFSWLENTGVAEATGLSLEQAALANQRDYSEPLLWQGSEFDKQRFERLADAQGYNVIEGGRFVHVTSGYDKGHALRWLCRLYAGIQPRPVVSVALGDSGNDVEMLEAADYAVVIRSPVKDFPMTTQGEHIQYSSQCGPAGWQECLGPLLGWQAPSTPPK
ncbi:MAG: HAD-IIB family hydrolase, partial [Oleiphilaceae bacterium]|nr:HAD-IIB family hydrolase [Oleiphilaceae bacterium]